MCECFYRSDATGSAKVVGGFNAGDVVWVLKGGLVCRSDEGAIRREELGIGELRGYGGKSVFEWC